jgi:sugar/nucleoside kinase (ribokinase family)
MYDVACVGILCADVLAKPVDKLPEKGKLGLIDQLQLQIGGCASNTAIDLAKLGIKSVMFGKIGADGFGKFLQETLQYKGVDISGLHVDKTIQTSASVVLIGRDGERSIIHCLGSNSKFSFEDINIALLKQSKILFIAGTFLMPQFDGAGAEKLLKLAKDVGRVCCMDTAWDSTGQWMNKIEGTLQYLDWFMPSYEEAKELSGKTEPAAIAEVFKGKGTKNVVIKLGKDGCYVKPEHDQGFYTPTYADVAVIDTSGAGDAFCAGFLTGLVKGWDIQACARFANAVGTHCVMAIGTTTGIKSLAETLTFMQTHLLDKV